MSVLSFVLPFGGGAKEIPVEDAIARVRAYCTDPLSGWHTYDRTSHVARQEGVFDRVSPWSILWAETLNGQPRAADVIRFEKAMRDRIANGVSTLRGRQLCELVESEVAELVNLCTEGDKGFWAPKVTKMLALYLPECTPVLDGNVAEFMGLKRDAFSKRCRATDGTMSGRRENIAAVIGTLRTTLRENAEVLQEVRDKVTLDVPDLSRASDVRLLDIILWTTQQDRGTSKDRWVDIGARPYETVDLTPVPVPPSAG
jgi:hypothetical protein